jgi:hypothetical protein
MLHVLLPNSIEDEDIIQKYHHKRVGEWSQYIIHQIMKVVGAFVKPKGMTNHPNRPSLDWKIIFHKLVGSMGTGW